METLITVMLVIFCAVSAVSVYKAYEPIVKKIIETKKTPVEVRSNIVTAQELTDAVEERVIAKKFALMLKSALILIHILINEGNKYDDEIQSRSFCSSLTTDVIHSLNSVEGKYE